jgi:hypothetical protein
MPLFLAGMERDVYETSIEDRLSLCCKRFIISQADCLYWPLCNSSFCIRKFARDIQNNGANQLHADAKWLDCLVAV